jgi:MoxR-like ATPase
MKTVMNTEIVNKITSALAAKFIDRLQFTPADVLGVVSDLGLRPANGYNYMKEFPRVRRGLYDMSAAVLPLRSSVKESAISLPQEEGVEVVNVTKKKVAATIQQSSSYVPSKDETYVAWGSHTDVKKIIASDKFYPIYIEGLSGNGKSMMVEQSCAQDNKQYVRVQVNPATDEDDLIGGFRLVDGQTEWFDGPVISAMRKGAKLLLDEIDRGTNKIMCLQGIMEGKPYLIKKTGEVVVPAKGFNILATGNTKGRGSEDGRFVAAGIIDEAFLERFPATIEQGYPNASIEKKILLKHMQKFGAIDADFAEKLVSWAETIRKTFDDGGIDEVISTRRLCHIVETYAIFEDRTKSISMCINRFDADVKTAFVDLYNAVDSNIGSSPVSDNEEVVDANQEIDNIINGAN